MGVFSKLKHNLEDKVAQFQNDDFLTAVLSGSACIAAADGSIDKEEVSTLLKIIHAHPALKVFDAQTVATKLGVICEGFSVSNMIGRIPAHSAVMKIADDKTACETLIAVCCAIAGADGNFDDDEKKEVRDLCGLVGLDPSSFLG